MRFGFLTLWATLSLCGAFDGYEQFFGGRHAQGGKPDMEYYDALGLTSSSSPADIKKAYRKMALQEHPDKGGDPEKFKKINEAYAVLSDDQKRAAYDRLGKAGVDGASGGGGFAGAGDFPGGFAFGGRGMGGMGGMSPEDIFAQMFGGMSGRPGFGQPRMRDQEMMMPVTLEELYAGGSKRVAIRRPYIAGGGMREERVEVDIPLHPGTRDGARFSIPGGAPHKANVVVTVRTRPHARFKRMGDDLVCSLEVSLVEALTGFRTSLRHLDGSTLNLACEGEVTRPGQVRRVRGCGMPRRRAGGKGDLLLRIAVRFPSHPLDGDSGRLLKQLLPRDIGSSPPLKPGERVHRLEVVVMEGEQEDGF